MTPEALKQTQDLSRSVKGSCSTVRLVCESEDVDLKGILLHSEVIERMIRELLDLVRDLQDEGADEDHIAAIHALVDELGAAEELLRQRAVKLARTEVRS
jgi:hypothetical protein